MENVYRNLRRAIQKDGRDVLIQPCEGSSEAFAYLDLTVRKPFTVMQTREYFAEEIFSLCVRTGRWSIVPIRFRAKSIGIIGHTFRLQLEPAGEWRDRDGRLLDALIAYAGEEAGARNAAEARALGTEHWTMYVIGVCIHPPDREPMLFGDPAEYVYFPNDYHVPFTAERDGDDFEIVPNMVPMLGNLLDVERGLEAHTASLGTVPETSTIEAVEAVTTEADGDVDEEIAMLLAAADEAFSDPYPAESGKMEYVLV